jgi:Contractile injection system tape measure protein
LITEQDHIIQKVNVDIDVPDIKTARHIYDNFSEFWNSSLLPKLEQALKNSFPDNQSVRYEKIFLDFSARSVEEIEDLLLEELSTGLISAVSYKTSCQTVKGSGKADFTKPGNELAIADNATFISSAEKILNNFIFFLRHGKQEWHISREQNWLDEILLTETIRSSERRIWLPLFSVLTESPVAIERLSGQFTSNFCFFIIQHFSTSAGIPATATASIFFTAQNISTEPVNTTLKQLLKILAAEITRKENFSSPVITEINELLYTPGIGNIIPAGIRDDEYPIPVQASHGEAYTGQTDETDEETGGIYVRHAGLILLHPFLQYFFKNLGLLGEEEFAGNESKEIVVHLAYFQATGHEQPYEHELIFEKYLCAWPRGIPVNRFVTLTDSMKQEAEQLLKAVIHHWKVLKNSSPAGLREGFLQRNGKLILSEQQHKLIIEKNSIDILLDQLPWSHSIITLPWLKKVLYTEWPTN